MAEQPFAMNIYAVIMLRKSFVKPCFRFYSADPQLEAKVERRHRPCMMHPCIYTLAPANAEGQVAHFLWARGALHYSGFAQGFGKCLGRQALRSQFANREARYYDDNMSRPPQWAEGLLLMAIARLLATSVAGQNQLQVSRCVCDCKQFKQRQSRPVYTHCLKAHKRLGHSASSSS